jgi:hypothetical protein
MVKIDSKMKIKEFFEVETVILEDGLKHTITDCG